MTKKPTAHDRAQKRYRARQKNDIVASAMGWEHTDIVSVYVRQDGVHVALDTSSQRVPLVGEQFIVVDAPERENISQVGPKTKKVYAPKSWDAAKWNRVVSQIQETDLTKEQAISQLSQGKTLDEKQKRQSVAVVEAMPDAPDWHASLPLAEDN